MIPSIFKYENGFLGFNHFSLMEGIDNPSCFYTVIVLSHSWNWSFVMRSSIFSARVSIAFSITIRYDCFYSLAAVVAFVSLDFLVESASILNMIVGSNQHSVHCSLRGISSLYHGMFIQVHVET